MLFISDHVCGRDDLVCMNGGSCTADGESPACVCSADYTGKQCESRANFFSSCFVVLLMKVHRKTASSSTTSIVTF